MPIGAAIGAIGSIASAGIGAWGANNAANKQVQAQQSVMQMLKDTIGPVLDTGKGIASSALGPLTKLLTPGADMTETLSQLPGFKFAQDWGQKAVQNLGSTMGLGGNTLKAGADYATGVAQQGYGNIVSQLQSFLNSGLTTQTNAASALAGGSQSAISGIGNAQASGVLGTSNALSGGFSGLTNSALMYGLGNKLGLGGGGGGIYGNGSMFPSGSFLDHGFSWGD